MRALVVDDDEGIRWVLSRVLREEGFEVSQAETLAEAVRYSREQSIELVFLDVYLPDGSGFKALREGMFSAPVVLLTAETTFDNAAKAYKSGAMEYLPKPFDLDEVRALSRRVKPQPGQSPVKETVSDRHGLIVGKSPAMQHLFRTLGRVAASDLTVLITGESGTGKELVAHILHEQSRRAENPFIAINAAAIPAELLESELFGHERGAFTGADRSRPGRFEQADGGTLFLDEIGDMPSTLQVKLLRVLEEGRVQRIGGKDSRPVNVRLLTATHQDLKQKIASGKFREDLFYRLNVIPVNIPPLRDRKDDIPELAEHLMQEAATELSMQPPIILDESLELLSSHDWPGNVRELKNVMRRLAVLTPGATITISDVALSLGNHVAGEPREEKLAEAVTRCMKHYFDQLGYGRPVDLHSHLLEQVEPALFSLVMRRVKGNQIKASEMLGLNRNTVRKKLKQYKINPVDFR